MLRPTSATCVYYPAGDTLGKLLAYISLTPYLAVFFTAAVAYSHRQVHMLAVLAGLICTEALARGLKHALRHPRPLEHCQELDLCDSFGMPSSHTACIAFAACMRLLLLAGSWKRQPATVRTWGVLEAMGLIALAGLVALSRVHLGYHSTDQVVAAAGLGTGMAVLWYGLMRLLGPLLAALPQTRLGKLLMLTDTWAHVKSTAPKQSPKKRS